eukprot:Filipodium_phascolosomae@DN2572_c0_g1_i5.p2
MCIQQSWCKVLSPQTMRQLHVWQSFSASQKDLAILNKILTKIMQIQEWLPQYLRDFPAASGKAHRSRSAASTSRNRDGTGEARNKQYENTCPLDNIITEIFQRWFIAPLGPLTSIQTASVRRRKESCHADTGKIMSLNTHQGETTTSTPMYSA